MIIEERQRDIGDFLVGRLLPFRKKRMVGPFVFFDHMGPKEFQSHERMDIGPHPHIGLSTLTYLLEGSIVHRDSLGTEITIEPGAVNWMTAGHGIVHSERSPYKPKDRINKMHGMQIWVALPIEHEDIDPSFHQTKADDLPQWESDGLHYKLVAGKAYDRKSPVPVFSDLFMVDITSRQKGELNTLDAGLMGEIGLYILEGSIEACGETIEKGHLLVAKDVHCNFTLNANTRLILFGGQPFEEERHIYWNFVATTKERLEAAKNRWRNKQFPAMPNDEGYVPLPGEH